MEQKVLGLITVPAVAEAAARSDAEKIIGREIVAADDGGSIVVVAVAMLAPFREEG